MSRFGCSCKPVHGRPVLRPVLGKKEGSPGGGGGTLNPLLLWDPDLARFSFQLQCVRFPQNPKAQGRGGRAGTGQPVLCEMRGAGGGRLHETGNVVKTSNGCTSTRPVLRYVYFTHNNVTLNFKESQGPKVKRPAPPEVLWGPQRPRPVVRFL